MKAMVGVQMAGRMTQRHDLADERVLFFEPRQRLLANQPAALVEPLAAIRAGGADGLPGGR